MFTPSDEFWFRSHGITLTLRKFRRLAVSRSCEQSENLLNGSVWTKWPVKFFNRWRIRLVSRERAAFDSNIWLLDWKKRVVFVGPWNENVRLKQKQQTNGNRAIWLVYRTDTNARGFWLVKRTLGWKNFMPENFLEINRYFALTSYCNTTG